MKGYKLTDSKGKSYNDTEWGEGISHKAKKGKMEFCAKTAIHFYADPLLAAFCNTIHGNFIDPILWEGETKGVGKTDGLKSICKEFTTLRQIPLPIITTNQRVTIGIKCALEVYTEPTWVKWAQDWLSNKNRDADAAIAVAHAAYASVAHITHATAAHTYDAAAAWAVWAATHAVAAYAAAYAHPAHATAYAAYAHPAHAAAYAAYAHPAYSLLGIIQQVIKEVKE